MIKSNSFIQNLIAFRHSTRFLETFNHKFLSKVDNNSISASPLSSWRHGSYTPFYLTHSWFEPNHNSFIHRCLKKMPRRESMCCHLKRAEARVDPCHSLHYHFKTPLRSCMTFRSHYIDRMERKRGTIGKIYCRRSHHVRKRLTGQTTDNRKKKKNESQVAGVSHSKFTHILGTVRTK